MNKILSTISVVFIVTSIIFAFLWRLDHNKYNHACEMLTEAESKINIQEKENKNILEYNLKKEEELKEIEEEYKERLDNITADTCGDTKTSKELLLYLRKRK